MALRSGASVLLCVFVAIAAASGSIGGNHGASVIGSNGAASFAVGEGLSADEGGEFDPALSSMRSRPRLLRTETHDAASLLFVPATKDSITLDVDDDSEEIATTGATTTTTTNATAPHKPSPASKPSEETNLVAFGNSLPTAADPCWLVLEFGVKKCITYHPGEEFELKAEPCKPWATQKWYFDRDKRLRSSMDDKCLDHNTTDNGLHMDACHQGFNQKWQLNATGLITSLCVNIPGKCIEYDDKQVPATHLGAIIMKTCETKLLQNWKLQRLVDATAVTSNTSAVDSITSAVDSNTSTFTQEHVGRTEEDKRFEEETLVNVTKTAKAHTGLAGKHRRVRTHRSHTKEMIQKRRRSKSAAKHQRELEVDLEEQVSIQKATIQELKEQLEAEKRKKMRRKNSAEAQAKRAKVTEGEAEGQTKQKELARELVLDLATQKGRIQELKEQLEAERKKNSAKAQATRPKATKGEAERKTKQKERRYNDESNSAEQSRRRVGVQGFDTLARNAEQQDTKEAEILDKALGRAVGTAGNENFSAPLHGGHEFNRADALDAEFAREASRGD